MAKKKNPEGKKVKRTVPFKLTDSEKAAKGESAAKFNEQLEAAVEQKKTAMKAHNSKIKGFTEKVSRLLGEINEGVERREVECIEIKNFEENRVEFWFEGIMRDQRPMVPDDRQQEMKIAEPKIRKGMKPDFPVSSEDAKEKAELAEVHRLESRKATKRSSVDKMNL